MNLYDSLQSYARGGKIPFHMPGHKRNSSFFMENPYAWDLTEIPDMDNLHHPQGILRSEMERLSRHYKTKDSFLLVNGSTCGILAAIASCCQRGERILVARNCHRSVYHAMFLLELEPIYLYPQIDKQTGILLDISPSQVAETLASETVSCVVLTSPTYEGVVSDIKSIANICHKKNIPLIVDEAHGAHFSWGEQFPPTAMQEGADLVIESLHKTLPALTQTALLHRTSDRVSRDSLMQYLAIFETSSPSYVLMASISQCISWLEEQGETVWQAYDTKLSSFIKSSSHWQHLQLWRPDSQEPSKLVIGTWNTDISGVQLAERLRREYNIEVEMDAPQYVLAMTSVADTSEAIEKLADALTQIDKTLSDRVSTELSIIKDVTSAKAQIRMNAYQAFIHPQKSLPLESCLGQISAEYAFIYPPGIPFLVPGEEITTEVLDKIVQAKKYGLSLFGLQDESGIQIRVCHDRV